MGDLLGGGADEIDFDAAASAFPDISLDGTGDIPLSTSGGGGGFDIDSFEPEPQMRFYLIWDIGIGSSAVCCAQTWRRSGAVLMMIRNANQCEMHI